MKRFLIAAIVAAVTLFTCNTTALAHNVGISLNIGQPGFYGRLYLGGYPPPRLLYRRPVAIQYVPINRPPIYMRVRPGHARQWRRYCSQYNACNERVYFVQHDWYHREYSPRYQKFNRGNMQRPPYGGRDDHDGRPHDGHDGRH